MTPSRDGVFDLQELQRLFAAHQHSLTAYERWRVALTATRHRLLVELGKMCAKGGRPTVLIVPEDHLPIARMITADLELEARGTRFLPPQSGDWLLLDGRPILPERHKFHWIF